MREQLIRQVEIIPIEVVVRNVAAGSLSKRLGIEEGTQLPRTIIEYYYKDDALGDPMIADEHIACFGWATQDEMNDIADMAIRVNDFLSGMFAAIGIRLIDFKLEFGRVWDGDYARVILADEISPDGCRLWDMKTNEKLDKDRFRQDLGGVEEAYQEVARRLGLLQPEEEIRGPRPRQPPQEARALEPSITSKCDNLGFELEQELGIELVIFGLGELVAREAADRFMVIPEREHLDVDDVAVAADAGTRRHDCPRLSDSRQGRRPSSAADIPRPWLRAIRPCQRRAIIRTSSCLTFPQPASALAMKRARVVTLNAALGPLDYRVPEGMAVEPGSIVVAPLGTAPAARRRLGSRSGCRPRRCGDNRLRPLAGVLDVAADRGAAAPAVRMDRGLLSRRRSPRCCAWSCPRRPRSTGRASSPNIGRPASSPTA